MNSTRFDFFVYTQNKERVEKALKEGDIDYGSFSKMSFVDEFFAFLCPVIFSPSVIKHIQVQG